MNTRRPATIIIWRNANPYPTDDAPTGPGRDLIVYPPNQGLRWDDTRHIAVDSASHGEHPYWWTEPPERPDPKRLTLEDLVQVAGAARLYAKDHYDEELMASVERVRAAVGL